MFLDPLHGAGYQWWSGIGSGSPIFVGLIAWWRHHNCMTPRCLRLGRHPTADGVHRLCRRHHPDIPDRGMSLEEIHERHHQTVEWLRGVPRHKRILTEPVGHTTTSSRDERW